MCKSFVNKILLCLVISCCCTHVIAQKRLQVSEMYFGVHGGVLGSVVPTTSANPNATFMERATLGGNGGLVFRYSGQKCCAIQVELNYMQRASHYLELPLLMHIYFGSPSCRGFVNLGPQVGYCVKATTAQASAVDWGIAGGLGFYYRSRHAGIYQLEARYDYSFSDDMALSINLAWLWEFKKK